MSLFVVLGAVMAVLPAPARLQGEEPVGGSPFFKEGPPLPPGAEPAPEAAQDQDWTEPAEAYPPSESLSEIRATTIPGSDAPIYPVLQEPCRFSRVYRSEILGRLWFRGEVLGWWTKGVKVPALVTTGPLDDGDTLILFGDSVIHDEMNPGGRLTLGWWWDPRQLGGVEASYLGLSSREVRHYSEALLGEATIARPYWDVTDGNLPKVEFVADPDADPVLGGSIDVRADIELQGAEVLLRRLAVCRPGLRVDMLGGYRYGRLIDRLTIDEFSASLAPPLPHDPPTEFTVTETDRFDLFKSTNDFHGGEAGLTARWTRGCWSVEVLGKVGLGGTNTRCIINGGTTITQTTTTVTEEDGETTTETETTETTYSRGLLAIPNRYSDTELTVLSELGVSLRYQLACDLWLSVGYNLLHWSHVGRAVDQIDLYTAPPEAWDEEVRPEFALRTDDFWAQGLNLRLEHQF